MRRDYPLAYLNEVATMLGRLMADLDAGAPMAAATVESNGHVISLVMAADPRAIELLGESQRDITETMCWSCVNAGDLVTLMRQHGAPDEDIVAMTAAMTEGNLSLLLSHLRGIGATDEALQELFGVDQEDLDYAFQQES